MSFAYDIGNKSIGATNSDGTPSSIMLDLAYSKWGEKRGYVEAEGAGIFGELGKGLARGGLSFVSSAANTFGMDEVEAKTKRFMAENADWFNESSRKSAVERFANWTGATIGSYLPMFAAQLGAAALTGGGSTPLTAAGLTARAARVAKATKAATMGVSMLQTYGDNVDRLEQALPELDSSTRRGMAFMISAAQGATEGLLGAERLLGKELAARAFISKAIKMKDKALLNQIGRSLLGELPRAGRSIAISGAEEGVEGVLQSIAFDLPVAHMGGDVGDAEDVLRRYRDAFIEEGLAGLLIGSFPATLHSINNIRAQRDVTRDATQQERDEVDRSPVSVNGQVMVDREARRNTEIAVEELRASLPAKFARQADLIENLAYKWAYEQHKLGNTSYRPEQAFDTLRIAVLTESPEHSQALIKIADDGEAAGLSAAAIHSLQYAYMRDHMKNASNFLHDLQEQIELRHWQKVIQDTTRELDRKAARFTPEEQVAVAQKAAQAIQMPVAAGDTIPARMVVDAFADSPELLRRAYVYGRIDGVQFGSQKVSLVLNSDLSARVVVGAMANRYEATEGTLGERRVTTTAAALRAEEQAQLEQILATQREGDEARPAEKFLEGVIFSKTIDLAKQRAASLRLLNMLGRADRFDTVREVATSVQPAPDATPAMREAAVRMGFTKAEVDAMSPAQLSAMMPRGWKPRTEAEIIAARMAGADVAPDVTTIDEYVNEAISKQKDAEAKAQADALEAEAKLQEQQRLGQIDAEVRAQRDRMNEKLERIRNDRARAERDAVAEFYRLYPEYSARRFEQEKQKAIQDAAVAVEDGDLRTRLLELTSARGEAVAQQEATPEGRAAELKRREDAINSLEAELKTIKDAIKALEARNPELAQQLRDMRAKETNLRVAMAMRMLPDEPSVLRQGTLGQYIPEVRLALFYQGADASTVVHELFHHFIENRLLPNALMTAIDQAFAIKGATGERQWTLAAKENAANAFLAYVKDNKLPKGSKLLIAFRQLQGAIQNHLGDMLEKTMGPSGNTIETTGKPLDLSADLKQWFGVGLKPRAKDEASVIYGRALTDSMLASDPAAELEVDQGIATEAARVAPEDVDATIRNLMDQSPTIYRGAKDYKNLSLAQKMQLKAELRELADVTDDSPVVGPVRLFPDGFKTRRQEIVDGVLRQRADQSASEARISKAAEPIKTALYDMAYAKTRNVEASERSANSTISSLYDDELTAARREAEARVREMDGGRELLDAIAAQRSEAEAFQRASQLADDMSSGDSVLRQRAKRKLKLLGLTDEELAPKLDKLTFGQVLNAAMRNWADYFGYDLSDTVEKNLLMDAMRAEVLEQFGFHKIENGQKVGSLREANGMTKELLVKLMMDDSKLEGPNTDLLAKQQEAAATIGMLNAEGYRSKERRSDDYAIRRGTIAAFRWINEKWSNPYQLVEYLTGGNMNNPLMVAMENMRRGKEVSERGGQELTEAFYKVLKNNKVDLSDMANTEDIAGWKLTKSNIVMLYTISNWGTNWDTNHIKGLRASGDFKIGDVDHTDAVIRAAVNYMNTEMKNVIPVVQWLDATSRYEFEAARKIAEGFGKSIPQATSDRYAPKVYLDGRLDPDTADGYMSDMFLSDSRYRPDSANPSWLMERSEIGAGVGMNLDYFSLMYRHLVGMKHFQANAEWVHDTLTLLQDQWVGGEQVNPIRKAIREKFGDDSYYNALVQYVKRAASPTGSVRNDPLGFAEQVFARLRKNLGLSALSYNLWPPLMQPLSGLHVVGQLGMKAGVKYAIEVVKMMIQHRAGITVIGGTKIDDLPIFKEVQALAPGQAGMFKSMYEREILFGLERLRGQKLNAAGWKFFGAKIGKFIENGLIPLNVSDAYFRVTAWKVAYDTKREELAGSNKWSASEKQRQAVNFANRIVGQTMNPADPNEKPLAISEGSEYFKTLMAFSGQPLAEHRAYMREFVIPFFSTYRMTRDAKGSRPEALMKAFGTLATSTQMRRWLFTMALPGLGLGFLSRKRLPELHEIIYDITAGGLLTKIPIIGPAMWTQAIYGISLSEELGQAGPLSSATAVFSDVYGDILKAINPEEEGKLTPARIIDSTRKSANIIFGLPDFGTRIVTRSMVMMLDEGREFDESLRRSLGVGVR